MDSLKNVHIVYAKPCFAFIGVRHVVWYQVQMARTCNKISRGEMKYCLSLLYIIYTCEGRGDVVFPLMSLQFGIPDVDDHEVRGVESSREEY